MANVATFRDRRMGGSCSFQRDTRLRARSRAQSAPILEALRCKRQVSSRGRNSGGNQTIVRERHARFVSGGLKCPQAPRQRERERRINCLSRSTALPKPAELQSQTYGLSFGSAA